MTGHIRDTNSLYTTSAKKNRADHPISNRPAKEDSSQIDSDSRGTRHRETSSLRQEGWKHRVIDELCPRKSVYGMRFYLIEAGEYTWGGGNKQGGSDPGEEKRYMGR